MAEQRQKTKGDTSFLLVQSAVCGAVLLLSLVLRLIGGGFYEDVRTRFKAALTDSGVADTIVTWLQTENEHA